MRLGWSAYATWRGPTCPRKLGRLVILRSDLRTWSEDSSRDSFEAVAGRVRERHEARMVVSGGSEHALTVLRTGRRFSWFPGFCSAAAPSCRGRWCARLDTPGERSPPRAPTRHTRLQSIEGLRQNCIPSPAARPPVRKSVSSVW